MSNDDALWLTPDSNRPDPSKGGQPMPHALSWVALGSAIVGAVLVSIPSTRLLGWIIVPIAFVLSLIALRFPGNRLPAVVAVIISVTVPAVAALVWVGTLVDYTVKHVV